MSQSPAIYISKYRGCRPNRQHPRCDNLQCPERAGGMVQDSRGVVCHPPIFYWEGIIRDSETRREKAINMVLCCFCAEECVDVNGQFKLYLVDTNKLPK